MHQNYIRKSGEKQSVRALGRIVGTVDGGVFSKTVRASKHRLRCPPAWALDRQSVDDAERLGAELVRIVDAETGQVWSASIAAIRQRGFRVDRGHGAQIALSLDRWQVEMPGQARQLALI